jgi:hypothetical protein
LARSFERVKGLFKRKAREVELQCKVTMAVTAASPASVAPNFLSESKDNVQNVEREEQQVKECRYELLCQQDSKGNPIFRRDMYNVLPFLRI